MLIRGAINRLVEKHPAWIQIIKASLEAAREDKEFAGSWVLQRAKKQGVDWFPNLRPLVTCRILEHINSSRGGRRAYYRMPDPEAVEKALHELEQAGKQNPKSGRSHENMHG